MSDLAVRVVGVGDAFTAKYYNACLLIECEGTRLLIDAPPALARALRDLGEQGGERVGLDDIDHVLITHLHGDHCGGLEQLLFWRRFVTHRKCVIYAIPEVLSGLWSGRLAPAMDVLMDPSGERHALSLEDYADLRPMPKEGLTVGPMEITWRPTIHHVPTSALKLRVGDKTFGYSADTSYDPSLIAWLDESDCFVHETNYGIHTPLERLAALPESTRARMRLIHYSDLLDVDAAPIECAREGARYEL